jgi:hypothetical protein
VTAQRVLYLALKTVRTAAAALAVAAVCTLPAVAQEPLRDGAEALAAARRLLAAGVPGLALIRIERSQQPELQAVEQSGSSPGPRPGLQPGAQPGPQSAATRWSEWEALRLGALAGLGRWQDVVARAEAVPDVPALPAPFLRMAWLAGADAALRLAEPAAPSSVASAAVGGGVAAVGSAAPAASATPAVERPAGPATDAAAASMRARALAARVIWSAAPAPDDVRRAQVQVVESLFASRDVPSGYRSMLRYRQDQPIPAPAVVARFATLLAVNGMASEALPLLPLLPEGHVVRLAVQVQLGLLPAPTATAQARATLRRAGPPALPAAVPGSGTPVPVASPGASAVREWNLLRSAFQSVGDGVVLAGASERMLDADPTALEAAGRARALWRDYLAAAPAVANREQLLVGDSFGWSDAAARIAGRDPLSARVLFAHLALHAPESDVRAAARLQLAGLLREAGMGGAAAQLFLDREAFDPAQHAADLRRLLAEAAAARRLHGLALAFRRGLDPRPGEDADEFRITSADWQARAGRLDEALQGAVAVFTAPRKVAPRPALIVRVHALADLFADAGDAEGAARLREVAGPVPVRRP